LVKTYRTDGVEDYTEVNHLCLYATGQLTENNWKGKGTAVDLYYLKVYGFFVYCHECERRCI
jgi:phenylalanyl-tRNA synthetase beta chain